MGRVMKPKNDLIRNMELAAKGATGQSPQATVQQIIKYLEHRWKQPIARIDAMYCDTEQMWAEKVSPREKGVRGRT